MFTIGAFGILFDTEEKVLLCHRRDFNLWDLPGGRVERGEMPWEGVVREVKEEVGLDVEIVRLVGVYGKTQKNDVIFSFICREIGGLLTMTDEADDCAYFSPYDLPKNLSPKHVERIMHAMQGVPDVFLTVQSDVSGWDLVRESHNDSGSP
jgi:ADP-ribose pyrophosphatase YjhB (NUDIX family)